MAASALPDIERLNALEPADFAEALEPVFERAPRLAERLAGERPFGSHAELLERAEALLLAMPIPEQIAVLDAHPRIGESPAAVRAVSERSYREQGYGSEAAVDPEALERTYRELAILNNVYEERFGFRFVAFVAGRSKAEILDVLRQRVTRGRDEELETGLRELMAIARDRLRSGA